MNSKAKTLEMTMCDNNCLNCQHGDCIRPEKQDCSEYFRQYYQANKKRIIKRMVKYNRRRRREARKVAQT